MKLPSLSSFPLFFSADPLTKPLDAAIDMGMTNGDRVKSFSLSDAHRFLDEIKAAKTDREATVKLGQLLMNYFEHNNINQSRIKNRLDKHEWSNKICFLLLMSVVVIANAFVGAMLALHMGD